MTIPSGAASVPLLYICEIHAGQQGVIVVQPSGTPYPNTQAQYNSEAQTATSADIAAGQAAASGFHATTTPGPDGITIWHAAAGLSPPESATLGLSPQNAATVGYSASGSATMAVVGPGQLRVTVSVSGLPAGSTHPDHIHYGTCSSNGGIAYSLDDLVADSSGNATATTVVSGPPNLAIPSAGWFVNVHNGPTLSTSSGATSVACGDVTFANWSVMRFLPDSLDVHVGDQVVWTQLAPQEVHTVTFLSGQPAPANPFAPPSGGPDYNGTTLTNSGPLFPFQTYSLTFTRPGTFSYTCLLHDQLGMDATVTVSPGYALATASGGVATFNMAPNGAIVGPPLNKPVVGMAATPDGKGYWLVAADGGIFNFGDAAFYGSMGDVHLNKPVVGMAATADGGGYWLVAADGGIFSLGDAAFHGSMGAIPL
ncbi:MAG: plastocyanin/azurin family copper-binding protein [Acidimicrobiales bacterium]